jgi:hypothetical protein
MVELLLDYPLIFVAVLLLSLGFFLLLAGTFTAYFGSGKSRKIGVALLVIGIIIGILVVFMFMQAWLFPAEAKIWDHVIVPGLVFILAFVVGAVIAIGMFLLAIMKS